MYMTTMWFWTAIKKYLISVFSYTSSLFTDESLWLNMYLNLEEKNRVIKNGAS